jgi:hypothetical protein
MRTSKSKIIKQTSTSNRILISQRGAVIYLFISCIFLAWVVYYLYKTKFQPQLQLHPQSNMESFTGTDASALALPDMSYIQCVVARYNEKTEWFKYTPFDRLDMICYNKGPKLPDNCFNDHCQVVNLDNVGRCDHTYLYHIVQNYNNLAPVTLFIPASFLDPHKKPFMFSLLQKVLDTKTTVLQGGIWNDIRNDFYDFTLDDWKATNHENIVQNPESKLAPCPIRPFGAWFDANFGENLHVKIFSFYGILAIAREHIIQHPIERYQKLIKYVDSSSNPEAGHYMERSWGAIFYPYPESCVYSVNDVNKFVASPDLPMNKLMMQMNL